MHTPSVSARVFIVIHAIPHALSTFSCRSFLCYLEISRGSSPSSVSPTRTEVSYCHACASSFSTMSSIFQLYCFHLPNGLSTLEFDQQRNHRPRLRGQAYLYPKSLSAAQETSPEIEFITFLSISRQISCSMLKRRPNSTALIIFISTTASTSNHSRYCHETNHSCRILGNGL